MYNYCWAAVYLDFCSRSLCRPWGWPYPTYDSPLIVRGKPIVSAFLMLLVIGFFLFFLFLFLNLRYRNPYKCIFVFGKKGAGKSCYMVRQMHRYLKKGWNVYTDMADVRIPGVRIIQVGDFSEFRPAPKSLVCLDEVGISMDNRSYKSFPPGLRDFFKYARKMEIVIIMNSQAYDVDKKVRDTTDSMLLLQSIGSLFCIARPIRRSITLTAASAESESKIVDSLKFSSVFSWKFYYMPAYFRYFDSKAMPIRPYVSFKTVHNDKRYSKGPLYNFAKDVLDFVYTIPSRIENFRNSNGRSI